MTPIEERHSSASTASLASEGSPAGHGLLSRHFSGTLPSGSPSPSEEVLRVRASLCCTAQHVYISYQRCLSVLNDVILFVCFVTGHMQPQGAWRNPQALQLISVLLLLAHFHKTAGMPQCTCKC